MTADERRSLNAAMARLAAGDRTELESVYARLAPPLGRFCGKMLGHGADAEDAAQQALETLYGRAADYDPSRDALSWALTIAAWECRTIRRKRSRSRNAPLHEDSLRDAGADPERANGERELAHAVEAAVGELRDEDRAVLEQVLDDARGDAAFRKRKQRMIDRLRAILRRTYDLDL